MKNVYLFQPQYAVDVRNETNYWLPYSVGCLWSYAQQFDIVKDNFALKDILFKRQDPIDVINAIDSPSICGFSCYVWNRNYCLVLAKLIKERWPDCIIAMGGPESSTNMLNLGYIDSVILAEGEESFVKLLQEIVEQKPPTKIFLKTRLKDLDVPSPYTNGLFDGMINDNPGVVWAMTLETNRGCPYACTFCDWGSATYSKVRKFNLEHVADDLAWAENNPISYIFCADANFGIFKERDVEIAKMLRSTADRGRLESVNVQYAKNSTEVIFTIAQILGDLSRGVTVSVQSMNDLTLESIKRKNLDINNIRHLMDLGQKYQVGTYTEAILGLPEETLETWKEGLASILDMGQHDSIDIWFCQLLENSELNSFESKVRYGIKTISAFDYMPYANKIDYKEIVEEILLVKATNTITTEEMVDAYMYGWMIIQFHISGYTQLYAKYCRNVLDISYRTFYDTLFEKIQASDIFREHYKNLKNIVHHYLTTGQLLDESAKGHGLGSNSFEYIYNIRKHAFDIGKSCTLKFTNDIDDIDIIQRKFIYDINSIFPMEIESPWDLATWTNHPTKYHIGTKNVQTQTFNFYFARRKGLLKNMFIKKGTV